MSLGAALLNVCVMFLDKLQFEPFYTQGTLSKMPRMHKGLINLLLAVASMSVVSLVPLLTRWLRCKLFWETIFCCRPSRNNCFRLLATCTRTINSYFNFIPAHNILVNCFALLGVRVRT